MSATKTLLILDLDETLVFGTEARLERRPDFEAGQFAVYTRPGADFFIANCFEHFEVAVWTASSRSYANIVVPALFGERIGSLRFVWSGERCTVRRDPETDEWYKRKPLRKVRRLGFSKERTLFIDNTARTFESNYGNAIRVKDFEGDERDDELQILAQYLLALKDLPDVRPVEKRNWRLSVRNGR